MNQHRRDLVLHFLLGRYSEEERESLEKFLPLPEREKIEEYKNFFFSEELQEESDLLEMIHWSWFLPILRAYSEEEQKLFLLSLDPIAAKSLAKELTLSGSKQQISKMGKQFFRTLLLDRLIDSPQGVLPMEYLPMSSLTPLLSCSKKELIHLIEILSLHDLAAELRQIVETKILKKIYSLLTEEEKESLKAAMGQKDPFLLGRLGLEKWDGTEEMLRTLLHKRGLARFAAGLSGLHPDFVWYVCHRLDIGRGTVLQKSYSFEPIAGVTEVIVRQIEEIL